MCRQALIVGLGYSHMKPKFHLYSGLRDASRFRQGLGVKYEKIDMVSDFYGPVNHITVLQRLGRMITNSKTGDELTFYFSGHGYRTRRSPPKILCGRLSTGRMSLLSGPALLRTVKLIPPGVSLTLFLECCYSGGLFHHSNKQFPMNATNLLGSKRTHLPSSVVVFTSTADGMTPSFCFNSFSKYWRGQNSIFTDALLKVMERTYKSENIDVIQFTGDIVKDYLGQLAAQDLKQGLEFDLQLSSGSSPALFCCVDKSHARFFGNCDISEILMDKGNKAMKENNFDEAADGYRRNLKIRIAHYGELAPECVQAYYKYGFALLYKAREESSNASSVVEPLMTVKFGNAEEDDEEESNLDVAWKMLDIARTIVEKQSVNTMEQVDILSTLADVALERDDFETSLSQYQKALSVLEQLVEPDDRNIANMNFRICLCLEVGSRPEEAIAYCEKAAAVCKARLHRLTNEVKSFSDASSTSKLELPGSESNNSVMENEAEIETLTGLACELEKKLNDLQQQMPASSSQLATANSSGGFDSPTISTAHTTESA